MVGRFPGLSSLAATLLQRCGNSTAASTDNKIGFIGLGAMGARMADNLRRAGNELVVFDRSIAALERFCAKEETPSASSPAAVAETEGVRVLITMLPSTQHVQDVYTGSDGILAADGGLRPSLLIDCSTISPVAARELSQQAVGLSRLHQGVTPFPGCSNRCAMMVDAPVSGGVPGARAGTLTFMCGGEKAAIDAAGPFLKAMGRKVWHCGEAGSGQAAKVCNNLALAIQMASIAEASALGMRLGLSATTLADIFNSSSARCWSSDSYHPVPGVMPDVPASADYKDGFATRHMIKDLRLALAAAEHVDGPVPMGTEALQLYMKVADEAGDDLDFSAIYKYVYGRETLAVT